MITKQPIKLENGQGYDLEWFEDPKKAEDYQCIICQLIPDIDTCIEMDCCKNIFCKKCIREWIIQDLNKSCPTCRTIIDNNVIYLKEIKISNPNKHKNLMNLRVRCPYGCLWKGTFATFENHIKECQLKLIECQYKKFGCTFIGTKNEVIFHEQYNDKLHLNYANAFYEENSSGLNYNKVKFDVDEKCKVTIHPHPLKFQNTVSGWTCDGDIAGCDCIYGKGHKFLSSEKYKCTECNYTLCPQCVIKHLDTNYVP